MTTYDQFQKLILQLQQGEKPQDEAFDDCLPSRIRRHAHTHFTPIAVALAAADFFSKHPHENPKILDVGSGAGKFCLISGAQYPKMHFTGIEQRKELATVADELLDTSGLNNVGFLCGNAMNVRYSDFQGVYMFNPFYEHLHPFSAMDESIDLDADYYEIYCGFVQKQLQGMPKGSRVVTYFGSGDEIPMNYDLVYQAFDHDLKGWVKR